VPSSHFLKKLPLNTPPFESTPDVAIAALSSQLINGYIYPIPEEKKYLTMNRPGLLSPPFSDLNLPSPIDGLFWWAAQQKVLATCSGSCYIIDQNGIATQMTGTLTKGRTKFAQANINGVNVVMASGGRLVYTDGVALTSITDLGAPLAATFVGVMDDRVVANEVGTTYFKWSDPVSSTGTITTWNGLNLAGMAAKGDFLQVVDVSLDDIILVGKFSIEHYYNDGVNPFSKYEGLTQSRGTIAPYSFIYIGNTYWWLDQDRNFMKLQGNLPKVVSKDFSDVLQNMARVDDCYALPINTDGNTFITLNFPTDKVTLVYDVQNEAYQGKWGLWNTATASWDLWYPNAYCQCPEWGMHLVGDRRSGKIYKIGRQYMYDGDTPLRMVKTTGWRDHGIMRNKRSDRIIITIQRGTTTETLQDPDTDNEPRFTVKSRDDGSQDWQPEREGYLGFQGDTYSMVQFNQNGIYRTRQDEYSFEHNVPVVIVGGEEEGEILIR
jgi:hypothetical protein